MFLPPFDVQERQADLLDAAKVEIALLNAMRDAFNSQKRGLMQKLLTGEWRVRGDSEKEAAA